MGSQERRVMTSRFFSGFGHLPEQTQATHKTHTPPSNRSLSPPVQERGAQWGSQGSYMSNSPHPRWPSACRCRRSRSRCHPISSGTRCRGGRHTWFRPRPPCTRSDTAGRKRHECQRSQLSLLQNYTQTRIFMVLLGPQCPSLIFK